MQNDKVVKRMKLILDRSKLELWRFTEKRFIRKRVEKVSLEEHLLTSKHTLYDLLASNIKNLPNALISSNNNSRNICTIDWFPQYNTKP